MLLFGSRDKSDRTTSSLDDSRFGKFANLSKPYKDASKQELDREFYLGELQRLRASPVRMLEEAARIATLLNRLRMKPSTRQELLQTVLGQTYPVVALWYDKFQQQDSSLPETEERRYILSAAIAAVEQIAIGYKQLFDALYRPAPAGFGREHQALYLYGLRILELLRLNQRLKALRYQKMSRADWRDANELCRVRQATALVLGTFI